MKTLLINASPKKRFSNSAYFMKFAKLFMQGKKNQCTAVKLPVSKKYDQLFLDIAESDQVVLALPLYVDGIPSHVLRFLANLEKYIKENGLNFKLYVIANCGFFEGRQMRHLFSQMQTWCQKAGIPFGGGVGIGAGEMLGFIRITPFINLAIGIVLMIIELIKQLVSSSISYLELFNRLDLLGAARSLGFTVLFSLLAAIFLIRLAIHIKKGSDTAISFTTVLCPKFLFRFFAAIYWFLRLCIFNLRLPYQMFHREKTEEIKLYPDGI